MTKKEFRKKRIKKLSNIIGIDGAIAYSILGRVVQAGGGIISIFFISRYLSEIEQGYYYTFASILSIQIFFELGLSNIIIQYVAHEMASLKWDGKTNILGDADNKSRLSSLLRFCIKWYCIISLLVIVFLILFGYYYFIKFGKAGENVSWQVPWIVLAIVTGINLLSSPLLAFLEGLGKVKDVSKLRLFQQVIYLGLMYIFLIAGLKLVASPIAAIISAVFVFCSFFFTYIKQLLLNIWKYLGEMKVNYRVEIFPYQWRIALSWMSGYFMYQCFNPIVFATEGANAAGQMGMTLAVLNGILSIALTWTNTKVPLLSSLIAKKDYVSLDVIFNRTALQATVISSLCVSVLVGGLLFLDILGFGVVKRFLPIPLIFLLGIVTVINQLISALATYIRCHKREPFMVYSMVMGLLTIAVIFIFSKMYGINGIVGGYAFLTGVISLPWAYFIFKIKKKDWHE